MKTLQQVKTLFLAWQDYHSREWFPIGKLTFDGKKYKFVYINGAKDAQEKRGFKPLLSFPNFEEIYYSTNLFPIFANRLMSSSRPEYHSFLERLNLSKDETDLMKILAHTDGKRETDSLTIFPYPSIDEKGKYHLYFLAHGLRYLPPETITHIETMKRGEQLWLAHEFHNPYDNKALTINTADHYIVGYCPRYLVGNIFDILMQEPQLVEVKVAKINHKPTPIKFRLLCEMIYSGIEGYCPFQQKEYQPISQVNNCASLN